MRVNAVTTFFSQNQIAAQQLVQGLQNDGISKGRIKQLNDDILKLWNTRIRAKLSYLLLANTIGRAADDKCTEDEDLLLLADEEK